MLKLLRPYKPVVIGGDATPSVLWYMRHVTPLLMGRTPVSEVVKWIKKKEGQLIER